MVVRLACCAFLFLRQLSLWSGRRVICLFVAAGMARERCPAGIRRAN